MPKPTENFGKNLRHAIDELGISQAALSRSAEVTPAQISDYVNGKAYPTLKSAERLADALGVSLAALIGEEIPQAAPPVKEQLRLKAIRLLLAADDDGVESAIITLEASARAGAPLNKKKPRTG